MADSTLRSALYLPGGGSTGAIQPDEIADIDKLNDNFRRIDELLGAPTVTSRSALPSTGFPGQLAFLEDVQDITTYNGDKWIRIGGVIVGSSAEREQHTPIYGQIWIDTDGSKQDWIGSSDGVWRKRSGILSVSSGSWQTTFGTGTGFVGSRTASGSVDTWLEDNETFLISTQNVGTGYGQLSVAVIGKGLPGGRASISFRHTQFHNPIRNGFSAAWQITPIGL